MTYESNSKGVSDLAKNPVPAHAAVSKNTDSIHVWNQARIRLFRGSVSGCPGPFHSVPHSHLLLSFLILGTYESLGRIWRSKREGNSLGRPPFTLLSETDESAIVDSLERIEETNDVVIVDLEGVAGLMSSYVASSSDLCIVPMRPSALDGDAAGSALKLIQATSRAMKRVIPSAVLITQTDAATTTASHREVIAELDRSDVRRCRVELIRRAPYERVMAEGRTLFELEPSRSVLRAQDNAGALAREIAGMMEVGE